jgi:peptidoglycan/LPS O-acetylase OafA/YrhL
MKKSYVAVIITTLVLVTTVVWVISSKTKLTLPGIAQFAIILVLVGLGTFAAITRLKSNRRGEPPEDELSKKILQKASSVSYFISIYIWLAIGYFSDKTKLETHTLIGAGILAMAVIFCLCWIYIKIWGTKDV